MRKISAKLKFYSIFENQYSITKLNIVIFKCIVIFLSYSQ